MNYLIINRLKYFVQNRLTLLGFGFASLLAAQSLGIFQIHQALANPTQFGSRSVTAATTSSGSVTSSNARPAPVEQAEPPALEGVEWLKVPYDKAENEVLALFQKDLPKLVDITTTTAIFEVRTTGQLPSDYHKNLRSKLERVLLTEKRLTLKQCPSCEESRLTKTPSGEIRYEEHTTDPARPIKMAADIGVENLLYTDMTYSSEDLLLRVRLVQPSTGQILWSKEYSTADVVKTRENLNDSDPDELSQRDSLARVLLGEVAFSLTLEPGLGMYPSIDSGSGSQLNVAPTVDLFIGERFDRGRKLFGFQFGGSVITQAQNTALPWTLRFGPKFGYVFNPYNVTSARFSIATELGVFLSNGVATGYFGIGPEVKMIRRFSVSFMPIYILPANVMDTATGSPDAGIPTTSKLLGTVGGLGLLFRAGINW